MGTTRLQRFPIPGAAVACALSILYLSAVCANAQDWVRVPLGTTDDIYAIDNTFLPWRWVSGEHGFAARSDNTRTSWTTIPSGTEANLFSVQEPGGGEVWFGAGGGTVRLRVYQFWFDRNLPDTGDYRLFTRRGAQAIAVGPDGKLYQSIDAGNNWTLRQTGTTARLNNGDGLPSGSAWAVGNSGTILRTSDGVNWTQVPSGTTADLYGIAELDYTNVCVVGSAGTILKSTDGGLTWSPKSSGTRATLRAVSISKVSQSNLIAVGLAGTVLRSTDAGETWCRLSATSADLYAAEAVNDTEFLIGGVDGLLLRTTNGGGPAVNLGFGVLGSSGKQPLFEVCGLLSAGMTAEFILRNAPASMPAAMLLSNQQNPTPTPWGTIVPLPTLATIRVSTDPHGRIQFTVPGGLGPAVLYAQWAMADLGLPTSVGLSNALQITWP